MSDEEEVAEEKARAAAVAAWEKAETAKKKEEA